MFSSEPMWICAWCKAVCHVRCHQGCHSACQAEEPAEPSEASLPGEQAESSGRLESPKSPRQRAGLGGGVASENGTASASRKLFGEESQVSGRSLHR